MSIHADSDDSHRFRPQFAFWGCFISLFAAQKWDNVCVHVMCLHVSLFQDELDLSDEHRANMFALPAEKKWQIYWSKKMV